MKYVQARIRNYFEDWNLFEKLWIIASTLTIVILSLYWKDNIIGIISATTGVVCVVLTAKGKISCYYWGIVNCIFYSYIAFRSAFYGEVIENLVYFLPCQFIGIFTWKKHMRKENNNTGTVIKRRMKSGEIIISSIICLFATFALGLFLKKIGNNFPLADAAGNILSIWAMYASIKRFTEQWIAWIIVDVIAIAMWVAMITRGSTDIATLVMWSAYLVNAIYGFVNWSKNSIKERA